MTIEFVLNVSWLKIIFSNWEGQGLDSAMSTICHIGRRPAPHEMDFCSDAVTFVPMLCFPQPGLLNKVVTCLLLIARTMTMIWRDARRRHARQIVGDGGGGEESCVRKARIGRRGAPGPPMRRLLARSGIRAG
jgi:hypothetical protein